VISGRPRWIRPGRSARAVHPLDAELAKIDGITSPREALDVAFAMQPLGVNAFFGFFVGQDEKASDEMAVHLYQSGLGLPDRDSYVNPDAAAARSAAAGIMDDASRSDVEAHALDRLDGADRRMAAAPTVRHRGAAGVLLGPGWLS
jgi:predicted metalloendopeptidase